jgi:glycosyltransferase involved in cell wall biosynthesis
LENWVVKMADKIILVTEWSRKSFQDRYSKQPANKFVLIPNGCDLGEFAILNSMSQVHRTSGFKIVHAGSLNVSRSWGRSPEGLFKAVRQLRQSEPELARELSMVFAGDLPEEHRRLAEEMGLADVINSLGHVPHEEVLRLLKSADLLLAINYEGWSTLIPGKIYEYWAVGGAPILLLSCPGAAASFVKQNKLGFTVDPSDIAGIHQSILTIYRQSKTTTPLRVSTTGIEAYDRQALACRLAQALSTVI